MAMTNDRGSVSTGSLLQLSQSNAKMAAAAAELGSMLDAAHAKVLKCIADVERTRDEDWLLSPSELDPRGSREKFRSIASKIRRAREIVAGLSKPAMTHAD
jgi:hypothetical protein